MHSHKQIICRLSSPPPVYPLWSFDRTPYHTSFLPVFLTYLYICKFWSFQWYSQGLQSSAMYCYITVSNRTPSDTALHPKHWIILNSICIWGINGLFHCGNLLHKFEVVILVKTQIEVVLVKTLCCSSIVGYDTPKTSVLTYQTTTHKIHDYAASNSRNIKWQLQYCIMCGSWKDKGVWSPYCKAAAVSGTGAVLRRLGYPRVRYKTCEHITGLQNTFHNSVYCPTNRLAFFTVVGMMWYQVPNSLSYEPLLRDNMEHGWIEKWQEKPEWSGKNLATAVSNHKPLTDNLEMERGVSTVRIQQLPA